MTINYQILETRGDAAGLERIYRQALSVGNETAFRDAIREYAQYYPEDVLYMAWAYRLDIKNPSQQAGPDSHKVDQNLARRWWAAVSMSVVLGALYALCSGDRPPVPIPGEANPLFWIGWSPIAAWGMLFYLALGARREQWFHRYILPAAALAALALYVAMTGWGRTDDKAILSAIHLPFVAWAFIGAALTLGRMDPARQRYALLIKSVETLVTGGIYFAAGVIFLGLTGSIFAVLGIKIPDENLQTLAAWGIGAIPVLALATIYDPTAPPAAQDGSIGLALILRILARLILPLALGVLAVYVFWFVPANFWRPFQERQVLMVYNATILAILALLTIVVSGPVDQRSGPQDRIFRYAFLALAGLVFLLNIYALAAISSRIFQHGLTPNRYTVFGWNVITLLMIAMIGIRQWRRRHDPWVEVFRASIGFASLLAVGWALWVLIGLPLSFE